MAKIVISERYTKEAKKAIKNCSAIYCAVAPGAKSPAVVGYGGSVFAVILPIWAKENEKINAAMREFCKA